MASSRIEPQTLSALPASERLAAYKPEIERLYVERVRQSVPAARNQDPLVLRNNLPEFLEQLIKALSRGAAKLVIRSVERQLAKAHGKERASLRNFSLDQLIYEYHILRQLLFEFLEKDAPLSRVERDIVLDMIQIGVRNSASQFIHSQGLEQEARWSRFMAARLLVSVLIVAAATLLQWLLWPIIKPAPYILFYPAVLLAALYGNGYLAALLSAAWAQYLFTEEPHVLRMYWPDDVVRVAIFLANSILITRLTKALRKARNQAIIAGDEQIKLRQTAEDAVGRLEREREIREMFVATLTHDLRSPLTAAKTSVQTLLRHPEKAEIRERLHRRIEQSTERANQMIQNLLDANLIRAGQKIPVHPELCNLQGLAESVLDELSVTYGDRFVLRVEGAVSGYWDANALRRVLENLGTNAVKYGAPDTPIATTLRREGDRVQLRVHNEGKGLTETERATLFDAFRRTDSARRSGKQGWGLGLTLVRGIAEAHGGTVKVDSAPERGATFTVELPVEPAGDQATR